MVQQLAAISIFVAVFAMATLRKVHLGITMFAAACAVGVALGNMPLNAILGGFPVGIMILLVGVTYFFGIAQVNGTVHHVIEVILRGAGGNPVMLPLVFFSITAGISAMGSPLAALVIAPLGMPVAKRYGMDPMLMGLAIGDGLSAGAFAPTSLFGIVTYGTAHQANIDLNPFTLFAIATAANLCLLAVAFIVFGGTALIGHRRTVQATVIANPATTTRLRRNQIITVVCMIGLVISVITASIAGLNADIGVLCMAFSAALAFLDPSCGKAALSKIDWSTVLLVGGIITFVGVLQNMGAVELLGTAAKNAGTPIVTALVICFVGALVSAFASTTGILAALVPLSLPLVASGSVAGWALISALAVCASIVDVSPFSTVGATLIATVAEEDRPRMTSLLTRWGFAMILIGPIGLVALLVLPTSL